MIPIRDLNPTRSSTPVTFLLIAAAAAVFFAVQPRSGAEAIEFLYERATIPCEVVAGEPLTVDEIATATCDDADPSPQPFPDKNVWLSLVVAIFLHGGVLHLVGNLWILWIFGNNVEEDLGHLGFALFYATAGLAASVAHVAIHVGDTTPVVGASGAIAGVMGAYLVFHPRAMVISIVPPLYFLPFPVPAAIYLLVWFWFQFLLADQATNIAWEAHVAGFVFGVGVALVLRLAGVTGRRRRRLEARYVRRAQPS